MLEIKHTLEHLAELRARGVRLLRGYMPDQ